MNEVRIGQQYPVHRVRAYVRGMRAAPSFKPVFRKRGKSIDVTTEAYDRSQRLAVSGLTMFLFPRFTGRPGIPAHPSTALHIAGRNRRQDVFSAANAAAVSEAGDNIARGVCRRRVGEASAVDTFYCAHTRSRRQH